MAVSSTIHFFSCVFSVVAFAWLSAGKNCQTLDGKWYNQLGSEIFLKHENDGRLLGEYRTAVERRVGSAGETHSILLGKYDNWVYTKFLICNILKQYKCKYNLIRKLACLTMSDLQIIIVITGVIFFVFRSV